MIRRGTVARPLQPMAAIRAMRALLADPDDTAQVFRIVRSLSGNSFERLYQRVLADPTGSKVLGEKRQILDKLQDREHLRTLPEGTLGREYVRFLDREGISPEGLVEASEDDADLPVFLDQRAQVLSRRLRDTHDLWHVVTGYQRDLFGEAALLAFTHAQIRNPGVGFIVMVAMLKQWREGHRDALRMTRDAHRRGRRAGFLAAADWETLLELPLPEVRQRLNVPDPPAYSPMFSAAAAAAR